MNALKTILRELVGLVVDDVWFAALIVGWIVLVWLLSVFASSASPWVAILLFAGLGAILLEGAIRNARPNR